MQHICQEDNGKTLETKSDAHCLKIITFMFPFAIFYLFIFATG